MARLSPGISLTCLPLRQTFGLLYSGLRISARGEVHGSLAHATSASQGRSSPRRLSTPTVARTLAEGRRRAGRRRSRTSLASRGGQACGDCRSPRAAAMRPATSALPIATSSATPDRRNAYRPTSSRAVKSEKSNSGGVYPATNTSCSQTIAIDAAKSRPESKTASRAILAGQVRCPHQRLMRRRSCPILTRLDRG
jgi:hypothetical protein